ncbi:MAG TPA: ATP-binding protein [Methanosarcinaceae archaeon]|nr:ATP-binding protein [Methanosarcinaceae archaeon]
MRFEDISRENPWWKFGNKFHNYDRHLRELHNAFIEYKRKPLDLKNGNIYIIRGMRQIGKTTYIKQTIRSLLENDIDAGTILYISCDRLSSRKELHNLTSNFIQQNIEARTLYLFLDEITYLKDWVLELKNLADSNYIDRLIIVATGSNPIKLKEKTERLPGRRVEGNEYYFKPLNFRDFVFQSIDRLSVHIESQELADALVGLKGAIEKNTIDLYNFNPTSVKNILPFKEELDWLFATYTLTGGIPVVINDYLAQKYINKKENIGPNIYERFIRVVLGDITKLRRSETTAKAILKEIILKYASRYSFTKIGNSLNISHQTVIEYLELFENSLLIEVVSSYDFNKKSARIKGNKKIYFSNPFIYYSVAALLSGEDGFSITEEILLKNRDILIEGMVANHLARTKEIPYLKEWKTFLWMYYTKTGKEIDFIYKGGGDGYLGIEVKYREEVDIREITHIRETGKDIVLTKNQFEIVDDMTFIPIPVFLAGLGNSQRTL